MIKKLNRTTVEKVERPVKILQFGEGNFLRAFVDWQIDIANEKASSPIWRARPTKPTCRPSAKNCAPFA